MTGEFHRDVEPQFKPQKDGWAAFRDQVKPYNFAPDIQITPKFLERMSKPAPGYPIPGLELHSDKAKVKDKAEPPRAMGDGLLPLEAITPKEAKAYLHGDGKGLPPIVKDFRQIGLDRLEDKTLLDSLKPQVHVSTKAGDRAYPLGSEKNPYTSIQSAVDLAGRGSVINVHRQGNDVYREKVTINRSDLVLTTDAHNPAVIDLGGKTKGRGDAAITVRSGVQNVDIKNFEIRNFSGQVAGIKIDGNHIKNINIAGNDIHSASGAEGIRVYGRGSDEQSKLSNINILSNKVHDLKLGELEAIPINGNVSGFNVIGNAGYKLDNIFIDAIGGEGTSKSAAVDQARNGRIEFNFAHGVSTVNNKNSSESGKFSAAAIYSDGAKDLSIRNNYIVASDFGIEVGGEHNGLASSGVKVSGNVVENSNFVWLGRGGDPLRPGGARDSYAKNNVAIGNADVETQSNVSNFPVENNPGYKSIDTTKLLPKSIAVLARKYGK